MFVYVFGDFGNKRGIKETKTRTFSRDCLRIWRFWEQTRDKNKQTQKRLGELTPLVASISKPLIITALLLSLAKTALLITLNSQLTKP
ncbi:hypothetical protein, partial [Gardnerella vaginalis]|uniref:hypothetical protein n=1 Tax=Gardnerella vaginalis TaxID=2702 RepID=UPI0039F0025F